MPRPATLLLLALVVSGPLAACGAAPPRIGPTGVDGLTVPTPTPDPADFVEGIDNEHLPLTVGSTWTYRADGEEGAESVTVTVTSQTRVVQGVATTVVHGVVRDESGAVVEVTAQWFAQDTDGNVWYFGEATTSYDTGQPSTEGSWEAGVDGAQAGLVMPAEPRVGDGFRQEFAPGVAEGVGEVIALDSSLDLASGSFDHLLEVEDTNPLEPDVVERRYYAPGVGLVFEEVVEGGDETVELVTHEAG